ncbi:MAG: cobalamin-dependent protein [Pontiellaceae bacterium]|jgi:lipid biosynthesis B12-binding/radical SAM protein|nr:cobalamin-dependent protein [Pontiellaceae bacterium]
MSSDFSSRHPFKIFLISANIATSPYPVFPIGVSMIAAALKNAGFDVQLFDFLMEGCSLDRVREAVKAASPGLIGISIRNIDNVNSAHEQRYIDGVAGIVQAAKAVSAAPVLLGGPGFSLIADEILDRTGADYGAVGEGEELVCSFAKNAEQGIYPAERILRAEPGLHHDTIPSAYYDPEILSYYLKNGNMVSIQTKRGCNKNCVYCSYPILEGRKLRVRHPSDVADDMEMLVREHKAKYIFFVDSLFNDSEGQYRELVYEMHRRSIFIPWTAFFTPDRTLDDEMMALMKSTGLHSAEIGADAASDTTLTAMGKDFTFADIHDFNDRFARHGVVTAHYYMFGGPGETPETVEEGINNIRSLRKTANFMFLGIRILPDTPLFYLAQREGLIQPGQPMVEPIYYFSPQVDRERLHKTLTERFADRFNCVFPPDALDDKLHLLHKLGYSGSMYDFLIKGASNK